MPLLFIHTRDLSFTGKLFHTAYMGTTNSSKETRARARDLAAAVGYTYTHVNVNVNVCLAPTPRVHSHVCALQIGAHHTDMDINAAVTAVVSVFTATTGLVPKFKVRVLRVRCEPLSRGYHV